MRRRTHIANRRLGESTNRKLEAKRSQPQAPEFGYRPDIDGLRAVAVLMVLLFHAGFGFPGGYAGVDVFFVISGYLITGLLIKDLDRGTFRLKSFWTRRVRRILPASIVVVSFTLLSGAFLLLPGDFRNLAMSAIAHQAMLANVYFWRTVGYFAGEAEQQPLLHMWSLAVEEQFYLLYPPALALLHRFGRRITVSALVVAFAGSLALSEVGSRYWPIPSFYLLPMRAWELLCGGLICFAPIGLARSMRWSVVISAVGLVGLVITSVYFTASTRFPGIPAGIPCASAAMIIYGGTVHATPVSKILAAPPVVFVGLISYSLYLWHWPLLAFGRYLFISDVPGWARLASLAITAILACMSWKFVEQVFRRPGAPVMKWASLAVPAFSTAAIIVISAAIVQSDGLYWRAGVVAKWYEDAKLEDHYRYQADAESVEEGELPIHGDENGEWRCIVWGDSHATAILPAIDQAARTNGVRVIQATHTSTPPVLDFVYLSEWGLSEESPDFAAAVVAYAARTEADIVVLAALWSAYADSPYFRDRLGETVHKLTESGCCVIIVEDVPNLESDVPRRTAIRSLYAQHDATVELPLAVNGPRNKRANAAIESLRLPHVYILDAADAFTSEGGEILVMDEGGFFYQDAHHLTFHGAKRLVPAFSSLFEKCIRGRSNGDASQLGDGRHEND